jgi:hypothetical protein
LQKEFAMKKILVGLLVLAALSGSVSAMDWTTYPDAIADDFVSIHLGAGIGYVQYGDLVIPPLIASADFNLPIGGLPFTLGGIFGITASKWEYAVGSYKATFDYTSMAIGARFGYHPNFGVKNLDAYANVEFGYWGVQAKASSNVGGYTASGVGGTLYYGANIGAQYFFTKNIGAFAELGYSALTFARIGLAVKF